MKLKCCLNKKNLKILKKLKKFKNILAFFQHQKALDCAKTTFSTPLETFSVCDFSARPPRNSHGWGPSSARSAEKNFRFGTLK